MIDFHSHILPGMDDGAENLEQSLDMLRQSFLQGVDAVVLTSHFYGHEEDPRTFLRRRRESVRRLAEGMLCRAEVYPRVIPGAEVLYFPGIGTAEEVAELRIGNSRCILVEPPMEPWSETMLEEIRQLGENFQLVPVLAHVDRYMTLLRDRTLMDRALQKGLQIQVNGSYFLNPKTRKAAFANLKAGKIHVIGSDSHNLESRPPNLGQVRKLARDNDAQQAFAQLRRNAVRLLTRGGD